MSAVHANGDAEIQPVAEPVESDPPTVKAAAKPAVIGNPWTTGLFDCHEHQTNAIMTAILPCVTFGQIAEVLEAGKWKSPMGTFLYVLIMPVLCSQWIIGSKYRKKLRKKYDLVEAPYGDKVSHFFCPCCSLCQEYRELSNRGLDPALGWKGILAKQKAKQNQDQQAHAPPPNQEMVK
ncbi:hypothetical protein Ancab_012212 [Ancistrocladus abbreviatus]